MGSRRAIFGIVLIVIGGMAACGGLTGSYDHNAGNPLSGGLLSIVLGIFLWQWGKNRKTEPIVIGTETAVTAAIQEQWVPPRPNGQLVEPWARGRQLKIVGESYRSDAFRKLLGRDPGFRTYSGAEIFSLAVLVSDPNNPDGQGEAVAVYIAGEHVGYFSQDDARHYHSVLEEMQRNDQLLQVPARAWASDDGSGRVKARVSLTISEPRGLRPSNWLAACTIHGSTTRAEDSRYQGR